MLTQSRGDDVVLAARGVSKRFSRRPVLTSIELELSLGSLTRLEAANGAGKSTLLRILAGVTQPDAGHVETTARPVGYVPDRWVPPSGFSARSFLRHMARLEGARSEDRSGSVLDRLEVRPHARARLTALSKGNAQKVLCAHAFGQRREVLILDEPTNGLDVDALAVLARLVLEARSDGAAVLLVDHGKLEVRPDRVVELRDGRVVDRPDPAPDRPEPAAARPEPAGGADRPRHTATVTIDGAVEPGSLPSTVRVVHEAPGTVVVHARETDVAVVLDQAVRRGWTVRAVDNPPCDR